jgi:caa(3)-type oxidase subunit IV
MATEKKTKKVSGKAARSKAGHGKAHAEHHHMDYITVWKYLVILLVASVVGPMFGIKALTLITAFGIAVVKAYLVVKHFMHLPLEKRFVAYFVGTALIFMGIFYAGVSGDVMNHTGRNWSNVAAKQETERALKYIAAHPHHAEGADGDSADEHAEGEAPAAH